MDEFWFNPDISMTFLIAEKQAEFYYFYALRDN